MHEEYDMNNTILDALYYKYGSIFIRGSQGQIPENQEFVRNNELDDFLHTFSINDDC